MTGLELGRAVFLNFFLAQNVQVENKIFQKTENIAVSFLASVAVHYRITAGLEIFTRSINLSEKQAKSANGLL